MTFSDLSAACDRLRSDPRVEGNTPIELETEEREDYDSDPAAPTFVPVTTAAISLAIHSTAGHRSIILSSLARPDALVR